MSVKRMWLASAAGTERWRATGSPSQLGKCFGSAVTQTRISPLAERRPETPTSTLAIGDAPTSPPNAATASIEAAQPLVRTGQSVPEAEIEAIIAPVVAMVAL